MAETVFESVIVVGAGGWGTALAALLKKSGAQVQLWGRDEALMPLIKEKRVNEVYLPGVELPEFDRCTSDWEALSPAEAVFFVVPSKHLRSVAKQAAHCPVIRQAKLLVSCTKGVEANTGESMSQVLAEELPGASYAVLTGPNHAEEVGRGMPTAAVVACADLVMAEQLQARVTLPWFRAYTSDDVIGAEWGGALKNPYAIAAGIARGLKLGDNAVAALVTRALAEMVRFGVAKGGRAETLYGLSGAGDLMVTCFSEHSRNHRLGLALGRGRKLEEILAETTTVAEGVPNTASLYQSARQASVRTPLLDEIYAVLYQGKNPADALRDLFARDPRPEVDQ